MGPGSADAVSGQPRGARPGLDPCTSEAATVEVVAPALHLRSDHSCPAHCDGITEAERDDASTIVGMFKQMGWLTPAQSAAVSTRVALSELSAPAQQLEALRRLIPRALPDRLVCEHPIGKGSDCLRCVLGDIRRGGVMDSLASAATAVRT